MTDEVRYELYYWPMLPGRGEFVRLAFEDAGTPYVDVAREPESDGGGIPAMRELLDGGRDGALPFAPPILVAGPLVIAQTANILHYLGPRLGLVPDDEASRLGALQLQLTITDFVAEVHDVHHPISVALYYEDQKEEAKRRAESFLEHRLPKFSSYFERVLERGGGDTLLGRQHSYVDLSLFHVVEGLAYAFPKGFAAIREKIPRSLALRDRVAARPKLKSYLASSRRLPFNEHGVFRHYPELDA